jgi:hypothetical protein
MPALVHAAPAFTAALTGIKGRVDERESNDMKAINLLFTRKA